MLDNITMSTATLWFTYKQFCVQNILTQSFERIQDWKQYAIQIIPNPFDNNHQRALTGGWKWTCQKKEKRKRLKI